MLTLALVAALASTAARAHSACAAVAPGSACGCDLTVRRGPFMDDHQPLVPQRNGFDANTTDFHATFRVSPATMMGGPLPYTFGVRHGRYLVSFAAGCDLQSRHRATLFLFDTDTGGLPLDQYNACEDFEGHPGGGATDPGPHFHFGATGSNIFVMRDATTILSSTVRVASASVVEFVVENATIDVGLFDRCLAKLDGVDTPPGGTQPTPARPPSAAPPPGAEPTEAPSASEGSMRPRRSGVYDERCTREQIDECDFYCRPLGGVKRCRCSAQSEGGGGVTITASSNVPDCRNDSGGVETFLTVIGALFGALVLCVVCAVLVAVAVAVTLKMRGSGDGGGDGGGGTALGTSFGAPPSTAAATVASSSSQYHLAPVDQQQQQQQQQQYDAATTPLDAADAGGGAPQQQAAQYGKLQMKQQYDAASAPLTTTNGTYDSVGVPLAPASGSPTYTATPAHYA